MSYYVGFDNIPHCSYNGYVVFHTVYIILSIIMWSINFMLDKGETTNYLLHISFSGASLFVLLIHLYFLNIFKTYKNLSVWRSFIVQQLLFISKHVVGWIIMLEKSKSILRYFSVIEQFALLIVVNFYVNICIRPALSSSLSIAEYPRYKLSFGIGFMFFFVLSITMIISAYLLDDMPWCNDECDGLKDGTKKLFLTFISVCATFIWYCLMCSLFTDTMNKNINMVIFLQMWCLNNGPTFGLLMMVPIASLVMAISFSEFITYKFDILCDKYNNVMFACYSGTIAQYVGLLIILIPTLITLGYIIYGI